MRSPKRILILGAPAVFLFYVACGGDEGPPPGLDAAQNQAKALQAEVAKGAEDKKKLLADAQQKAQALEDLQKKVDDTKKDCQAAFTPVISQAVSQIKASQNGESQSGSATDPLLLAASLGQGQGGSGSGSKSGERDGCYDSAMQALLIFKTIDNGKYQEQEDARKWFTSQIGSIVQGFAPGQTLTDADIQRLSSQYLTEFNQFLQTRGTQGSGTAALQTMNSLGLSGTSGLGIVSPGSSSNGSNTGNGALSVSKSGGSTTNNASNGSSGSALASASNTNNASANNTTTVANLLGSGNQSSRTGNGFLNSGASSQDQNSNNGVRDVQGLNLNVFQDNQAGGFQAVY